MLRAAPLLAFLSFLLFLVCDAAAQRNVTVDDTDAGVVYAPAGNWGQGATCLGCGVAGAIDPARAYGGTWHDTTTGSSPTNGTRTLTLSFTGTAVYVFCIVPNTIAGSPGVSTLANMSFALDGAPAGAYTHTPDSSADVAYGVPVFAARALRAAPHTLVLAAAAGAPHSLVLFDYAVYTVEDAHGMPTALVVGAAVGGVFGATILVLLGLLLWLRRRRAAARRPGHTRGTSQEHILGAHSAVWGHASAPALADQGAAWDAPPPPFQISPLPQITPPPSEDAATPLTTVTRSGKRALPAPHILAPAPTQDAMSSLIAVVPSDKQPLPVLLIPTPPHAGSVSADVASPLTAVMGPTDIKAPLGAAGRALPLPPGERKLAMFNDRVS